MSIIYVDADACPVRNEVKKVAFRYGLKTIMVSNGGIRPLRDELVEIIIVGHGLDVADDWIESHIVKNDIVITQDILLAARCLEKQALVVAPNGNEFSNDNIGIKKSMREFNRFLRETGEGGNYNAAFTQKDRSKFLQKLDLLIIKAKEAN